MRIQPLKDPRSPLQAFIEQNGDKADESNGRQVKKPVPQIRIDGNEIQHRRKAYEIPCSEKGEKRIFPHNGKEEKEGQNPCKRRENKRKAPVRIPSVPDARGKTAQPRNPGSFFPCARGGDHKPKSRTQGVKGYLSSDIQKVPGSRSIDPAHTERI